MSYYKVIEGVKYDRKILEKVDDLIVNHSSPFITLPVVQQIWPLANDGQGITPSEKRSLYYLLSTYQWEQDAEQWLRTQLEEPQESVEELIHRVVRQQHGLEGMEVDIEETEIIQQQALVEMGFPFQKALEKAIKSLVEGKFTPTPYLTPREVIGNDFQLWGEDAESKQQVNQKLKELLNAGSRIKLLPWIAEMEAMEDQEEKEEFLAKLSDEVDVIFPTEMESVKDYWIFYLTIEEISYLGWIFIDRESIVAPYIYGDNF